jgi:hypothetical protein
VSAVAGTIIAVIIPDFLRMIGRSAEMAGIILMEVAAAVAVPHLVRRGAGGGLEHMGTVDDCKTNLKTRSDER